jgi:LuxR family maltose regulon positive regulatory protein
MTVPLPFPHITTKLHIPAARPNLITRPRLLQRLDACIEYKLLLLSAPAGSGKTTLLGQWSQQSDWPVVWVSLDAGDNDPVHFWSYLALALDKLEPNIGRHLLPLIHSPRPEQAEFLTAALITLVAPIPGHFVLILDDYHCIETEAIHTALAYLLDYLPPTMHLILAGRTDPPLPLARWRARRQLLELRTLDLRFSVDETEALLKQVIPLNLSRPAVTALQERTEGWAAGLQLAALAIEDNQQRDGQLIPAHLEIRGNDRYLVDYLASEVLHQQPEPLRTFLLQTAILDRLDESLCRQVTGQTNSQAILEQLHRRNLFITALDRKGHYRYHHLFADFLRDQLQRDHAVDLPDLHLRAAAWYEQQDQLDQAISHMLAAGRVTEAGCLIQKTARQHLMRGEAATLLKWFKALPDDVIRGQPLFCLIYAWVLTNAGQVEAALPYLDHLENDLAHHAEARLLLGEAATVRARIGAIRDDPAQILHFSRQALALLPQEAALLRSSVYLDLAGIYRNNHDVEAAQTAYREAINLGRATGNLRVVMLSVYYLADLYLSLGQFQQAAQLYQQGLNWRRQIAPDSALSCWVHAGLGALLYEWNELTEAIHHLRQALELGRQSGEVKVLMYARITLAQALQTQGCPEEATATIQAAAEIAQQANIIDLTRQVELARLKLWLRQGQVDTAAAWLQQQGLSLQNPALSPYHLTMLAWRHLAQGQPASAELPRIIDLIQARSETAFAHHLPLPLVHDLILLALAHHGSGQAAEAVEIMARTVSTAEPMGLIRTFIDAPNPAVAALLRQVASRQASGGYLSKLVAHLTERPASAAPAASPPVPPAGQDLVEPLNQREIEVLQHISAGLSNQEIAEEMILAVSTVKWYLRNIYDKLQVNRRTQALARARELNLLSPN